MQQEYDEEQKLEFIEDWKPDYSWCEGVKSKIVKLQVRNHDYGPYVSVMAERVITPEGYPYWANKNFKIKIKGTKDDGTIIWATFPCSKFAEYLKYKKVKHPSELIGKEVTLCQAIGKTGKHFVSFDKMFDIDFDYKKKKKMFKNQKLNEEMLDEWWDGV